MRSITRLLVCGSVDDGKSTLIGRLLHDSGQVRTDRLAAAMAAATGSETTPLPDFARLLDGLLAEREQGITIDIAHAHFEHAGRRYLVADAPGHEQYVRNMATGASTADVAILVVDARKGLQPQSRRHAAILALFGVKQVVLAVNKMDLVQHDQRRFKAIAQDWASLAADVGLPGQEAIPIAAASGENLLGPSAAMPWHSGPSLLAWLDRAAANVGAESGPLRFPVQLVLHPDQDFRGLAGTVASGTVAIGTPVIEAISGAASRVARIVTGDGDRTDAAAGDAVALVLDPEIDCGRGAMLAAPSAPPLVARALTARLLWLGDDALIPGRAYYLQAGTQLHRATVSRIESAFDIGTLAERDVAALRHGEIGTCVLDLGGQLAFDRYGDIRQTGGLILIDRVSRRTVAAGMIMAALDRAAYPSPAPGRIERTMRSHGKGHEPAVVWFTGLSGAGKSTIANALEAALLAHGCHSYALDGDIVRGGLNRDLGFSAADRVENIRRIGEVAAMMADAGLIVTCAFISPYRAERALVRDLVGDRHFVEVHVATSLETCMKRDPKGLYAQALAGQIKDFTGIDAAYEPPQSPDLVIDTETISVEQAVGLLLALLAERRLIAR